ncbi:MAG: basic secretory protein-like protein [Sarcina sp.]
MTKTWREVCKPNIEYKINDSRGTKIFEELVGNKDEYIYEICEIVCKKLYKNSEEVPYFEKLTFIIDDFNGVAWKDGHPPHITVAVSSNYLEKFNDEGGNIKEEVKGILIHEVTHAYQHSKNMELFIIEGIADLTRYLSGYIDIKHRKIGGNYDGSYKITGFFFDYLREKHINEFDFLYELNQMANPQREEEWNFKEFIKEKCGKEVEELWREYQNQL